jgi:hypothetical protein
MVSISKRCGVLKNVPVIIECSILACSNSWLINPELSFAVVNAMVLLAGGVSRARRRLCQSSEYGLKKNV